MTKVRLCRVYIDLFMDGKPVVMHEITENPPSQIQVLNSIKNFPDRVSKPDRLDSAILQLVNQGWKILFAVPVSDTPGNYTYTLELR